MRSPSATSGRPVRKDEIELHDRGIYVESWLPERRSRRKPLMFVHGELGGSWVWERFLGYFAGRGWEGHALNLRNHHWSQTADPSSLSFDTYTDDVVAAMDRLGPTTVAVGHGMGGLLAMKAAERVAISAIILIGAELPRDLRPPARPFQLREIPEVLEIHSITGPGDLHCRVVARTNDHLQAVIGRILVQQGIDRSTTQIALTEQLRLRVLPLVELAIDDKSN